MKSREQFIDDIYRKSEEVKQKEAQKRKKIRRLYTGGMSLAACLILVFGITGFISDFSSPDSTGTEKALCQEQAASRDSEAAQMYSEDENDKDGMYGEDAEKSGASENQKSAGDSNNSGTLDSSIGGSNSADSTLSDNDENGKKVSKSLYGAKTGGQKDSVKTDDQKSDGTSTCDTDKQEPDSDHAASHQTGQQMTAGGSSENNSDENMAQKKPARMIRIRNDGSRNELDEEEMTKVLKRIQQMEKEQKAVCRRLGEPEPETEYTTKILFVLYDTENEEALDEDDLQNVVWYFLSK